MNTRLVMRSVVAGALVLAMAAIATPAAAQLASIRGKVVDEAGQPVIGATVTVSFNGDMNLEYTVTTNDKGEWTKAGLQPGHWKLTATKDDLSGSIPDIHAQLGEMTKMPDIVAVKVDPNAKVVKSNLSAEEIEKANKRQAMLKQLFDDANLAFDAGDYDTAITKLQGLTTEMPECAACYAKIGDVFLKKNDQANAETNYLKAVELNADLADVYSALATIYNSQKKFDKAAEMSAKGNELKGASATGGDPMSLYNQGIIFWNQGKMAEAKGQFEKAVQLDPKMADAQYYLGMAIYSLASAGTGKVTDAKAPLEQYLGTRSDRPVRRRREGHPGHHQVGMTPDTGVAGALASVRRRIDAAAARAGRTTSSVRLVAVSKTVPAERVREAAGAGQRAFGENRVQEALEKMAGLGDVDLEWHLIGHLQSNKARKAAVAFQWIHSIDSVELLQKVDAAAADAGSRPRVLVQADLAQERSKHGADEARIGDVVRAAIEARAVILSGLMTVPPFPDDPEDSRPWFRRLRELRDGLVADGVPPDRLAELSMGMTHDFEIAIDEGATIVRVGTAIFGKRPPPAR